MNKSHVKVGRIGHLNHGKTKISLAVLYALAGFDNPMPQKISSRHLEKV